MSEPAAAAAAFAIPGYSLGERIGAGGFGEVYRATHALMGREVAIKVLHAKYSADPAAVARFVSEARAVATISHPGIVDVFDFGQLADGRQYCVMELVKGTTLRELLKQQTRLPLAEALPILRGIAEAIDAAHAAGIAHRDLKPDNVFVLDSGAVKLIDFGLAKLTAEDAPAVTETGAVFGTPLYMSPEQCRGKAIDARTDAYSFGVLAYHVLVGEPPFTGEALEIALHHLNDPPPSANVSAAADAAIAALMAKDPAARPMPLATAIAALAGDVVLPAARAPRRRRGLYLALGAAATAGIVAVVVARMQRSPEATAAASCTPAVERLAGVWDAPRRAAIEARFSAVQRADIPGTWRALSSELDDYAAAWRTQWDAACTQDAGDAVLHAQRSTCLEAALVDLAGLGQALTTVDVGSFAATWPGAVPHATLASCTTEPTLRAQPTAPPAGNRDKIIAAIASMHTARFKADAALAGGDSHEIELAANALDAIANDLDALGTTAGNAARWQRARYLVDLATRDVPPRDTARAALDAAVNRAEATRDDHWLVYDHALRIQLEISVGSLDAADQAKKRADAALGRGGTPPQALYYAKLMAARLAAAHGDVSAGLARYAAMPKRDFGGADSEIADHARLLRRAGQPAAAVELVRTELAARIGRFGEQHALVAGARLLLAIELEQIGDRAGALAEIDRALAIHRALGLPTRQSRAIRLVQLDLAARAKRADLVDEAAAGTIRDGKPGPLTPPDWLIVAQLAFDRGAVDTVRLVLPKLAGDTGRIAPMRDEIAAITAAIYGDIDSLDRLGPEPVPPLTERSVPAELRLSTWLRGLGEIARGKPAAAEARLARLAVVHGIKSPEAAAKFLVGDGVVLVGLQQWRQAAAVFGQARGGAQVVGHGIGALDAWLGGTRVAGGELRAAIPTLEEALDVFSSCCAGYSWLAPGAELSLARALWDTGRDRPRARRLAEAARDHYRHYGARRAIVFPDLTLEGAERWLAEHTAKQATQPVISSSGCPTPKNPAAPGNFRLYIAAEGVTLTRAGVNDARKNESALVPVERIVVPPFLDKVPERATRISAIATNVQRTLAPYSIDVVLERPKDGHYWMTVLGGTAVQVQAPAMSISLAPFDCTANNLDNMHFAFDFGTKPKDIEYTRTILSDFGAMLGLAAVEETGDCMCRGGRGCEQVFENGCTFGAAGVLPLPTPACGRTEQDEGAMLKAALGCR